MTGILDSVKRNLGGILIPVSRGGRGNQNTRWTQQNTFAPQMCKPGYGQFRLNDIPRNISQERQRDVPNITKKTYRLANVGVFGDRVARPHVAHSLKPAGKGSTDARGTEY